MMSKHCVDISGVIMFKQRGRGWRTGWKLDGLDQGSGVA
jgi:hypothetical protein